MKTVTRIILINLAVVLGLLFVYPEFMISPGPVKKSHSDIETDCFACHVPLLGASSAACTECHQVAGIGSLTTAGEPIADPKTDATFHQDLREKDCVACHSEHRGVATLRTAQRFSHILLKPETRETCANCHTAPTDDLHQKLTDDCRQCHVTERWSPATFDHDNLEAATLEQCTGCHAAPQDDLHSKSENNCGQCHDTGAWSPATFDHDEYFRFDHDHNTECVTCHEGNDYSAYTCYNCHEHSPWNVRGEHLEEGIRDFEICVECHRSGDEDEAEWRMRNRGAPEGRSYRYYRQWHDDD
ncbi:cytochrome c3 family protein [Thiohalomonas denitrificans]|uniref:cytochrome c3 family protein n=1 Tax=Thiohalomonas denitrificans TaxID=415747 RepID=UPI0026EF3750|nr:cytochrome c3 family protein [Thiohalomonas denitrificans]